MARPLTRNQILENRAFLKALARTGNVRDTCRDLGIHRATMTKRRAAHPAFAAEWDVALALAHASLNAAAGTAATPPRDPAGARAASRILRTRSGRLQVRRVVAGGMTATDEQAFLSALSATANIRLSAAAAGFSHAAFYARRRAAPAFAREWQLALERGYEQLECALLEAADPASHADDAWRTNDPPAMPPLTFEQMMQLLHLHHKTARLWAEHPQTRRRAGETSAMMSLRLQLLEEARRQRERDRFTIAEADRRSATRDHDAPSRFEESPTLPDLAQVTGWSKASGNAPHHPGVALFGGWRLADTGGKGKA